MSETNGDNKGLVAYGKQGIEIRSLAEAFRFAQYVCASGFAPRGMEKPESVLIACQMGAEIGLTPMASLQNIAIINGRPSIYGDAALALVRASGLLESYAQRWEGEGDKRAAVVTVKRRGEGEQEHAFSVTDAKRAGLLSKSGPWTQYPDRMLLFRARGFALRDAFGDVLKGLRTAEEAADMPAVDVTPQVIVSPRPLRRAKAPATPEPASMGIADPAGEPLPPAADPAPVPPPDNPEPDPTDTAPETTAEDAALRLVEALTPVARNRDLTFKRILGKHGIAVADWKGASLEQLQAVAADVEEAGVSIEAK